MEMEPGTGIELFPAGGFVRLRSRSGDGTYLHADEDGVGVSLRLLGGAPSINTVLKVQHWYVEGDPAPYILLQTAYGRYLAATNQRLRNQDGFRVVQRDYNSPNLDPWFVWRPYSVGDGYHIRLSNWGRYIRGPDVAYLINPSRWIVTVLHDVEWFRRVHWEVVAIPSSPEAPPLPPPLAPSFDLWDSIAGRPFGRTIRYACANHEGDIDRELMDWPNFFYMGLSVSNLRTQLGHRLRRDGIVFLENCQDSIILCVWAGLNARPIPLITDLPLNQDPMDIVIYTNGSRASDGLRYPQFDLPPVEIIEEQESRTSSGN